MSQENWVDKFTRWFFWAGYAVFLGASIPHIATYFHHFDAPATGPQETMNWCVAVLLAIVIDVSDVLVSIAVIKAQAAGAKFWDTFGYWAFIVLIMALSWLFNWEYNIVFGTHEFAAADSKSLFGWITIGQLNPVVGSAFQLLLLVYTGMAHKFANKPHEKTAAELEQEATELESKQDALARIEAVKKARRQRGINNIFEDAKALKDGVIKTVTSDDTLDKAVAFLTQNPSTTDEELAVHLEKKRPAAARFWRLKAMEIIGQNQSIAPANQGEFINNNGVQSEGQNDVKTHNTEDDHPHSTTEQKGASEGAKTEGKTQSKNTTKIPEWTLDPGLSDVLKRYPKIEAWRSASRATVTVEEVMEATNYTRKFITNRIKTREKNGPLETAPRNTNLVLIRSLIDWLKTVPNTVKPERITDSIPSVNRPTKPENTSSQNAFLEGGNHPDIPEQIAEYSF